jgi:hypothetical protein
VGDPGGIEEPRLVPTAAGETTYRPVRRTVDRVTDGIYGDLPPADLEATRRTLAEVCKTLGIGRTTYYRYVKAGERE